MDNLLQNSLIFHSCVQKRILSLKHTSFDLAVKLCVLGIAVFSTFYLCVKVGNLPN